MAEVSASLPEQFTETEAARKLGIGRSLLMRERAAGKIRPIRYGVKKIRYTIAILEEYQQLCRSGLDKLGNSGSANDPAPITGAEHGSTPALDRHDAHRLAQAMFKRQR